MTFYYKLENDSGCVIRKESVCNWLLESFVAEIINLTAETQTQSGYEICDLSGQKLYPGESKRNYQGHQVRPKSHDDQPYREFMRYRETAYSGAKFSEREDVFVVHKSFILTTENPAKRIELQAGGVLLRGRS